MRSPFCVRVSWLIANVVGSDVLAPSQTDQEGEFSIALLFQVDLWEIKLLLHITNLYFEDLNYLNHDICEMN